MSQRVDFQTKQKKLVHTRVPTTAVCGYPWIHGYPCISQCLAGVGVLSSVCVYKITKLKLHFGLASSRSPVFRRRQETKLGQSLCYTTKTQKPTHHSRPSPTLLRLSREINNTRPRSLAKAVNCTQNAFHSTSNRSSCISGSGEQRLTADSPQALRRTISFNFALRWSELQREEQR